MSPYVSTFLELWVALTLSRSIRWLWFFDNFWLVFNALSVSVNWSLSFFNFYPIWTAWFHKVWTLLDSNLMAYTSKATRNWHVQHRFSHCRGNVASCKCKNNFLTKGCNRSSKKVFDSRTNISGMGYLRYCSLPSLPSPPLSLTSILLLYNRLNQNLVTNFPFLQAKFCL